MSKESIGAARALFNKKHFGVLSTISVKLGGFPFGSVVPYCADGECMPLVYLSTIAQHTKNLSQDARCSITIVADNEDVQAGGRLCVTGHMEQLSPAEVTAKARYQRFFPDSAGYSNTHDFSFFRLRPIIYRYIGGFGAIHWEAPDDFLVTNPFFGNGEDDIVSHMNEDHHADLVRYCTHYKHMDIAAEDNIRMSGIDSLGFDVFVNHVKVRFDFENPIADARGARAAMVSLSKGLP